MRLLAQLILIAALLGGSGWLAHDVILRMRNGIPLPLVHSGDGRFGTPYDRTPGLHEDLKFVELGKLGLTMSRPIFYSNRRIPGLEKSTQQLVMAAPSKTSQVQLRTGADQLKLHGVLIHGDSRRAYVAGRDGVFIWRQQGDTVDGWEISAIDAGHVVVQQGGQSATLTLYLRSSGH